MVTTTTGMLLLEECPYLMRAPYAQVAMSARDEVDFALAAVERKEGVYGAGAWFAR